MLKLNGYYIIKNKAEWDRYYNTESGRFQGNHVLKRNIPHSFPAAFQLVESWDAHFCDSLYSISLEKAIEEMKIVCEKGIESYQDFIKELEEIQHGKN